MKRNRLGLSILFIGVFFLSVAMNGHIDLILPEATAQITQVQTAENSSFSIERKKDGKNIFYAAGIYKNVTSLAESLQIYGVKLKVLFYSQAKSYLEIKTHQRKKYFLFQTNPAKNNSSIFPSLS